MPKDPPSTSHFRRSIAQPPTFVMQPVTSKLTESTGSGSLCLEIVEKI